MGEIQCHGYSDWLCSYSFGSWMVGGAKSYEFGVRIGFADLNKDGFDDVGVADSDELKFYLGYAITQFLLPYEPGPDFERVTLMSLEEFIPDQPRVCSRTVLIGDPSSVGLGAFYLQQALYYFFADSAIKAIHGDIHDDFLTVRGEKWKSNDCIDLPKDGIIVDDVVGMEGTDLLTISMEPGSGAAVVKITPSLSK